jgi:uncharacterized protein YndB with AHSA1/START domain
MKRDLHFEATYSHPPQKVWRALTDSSALAQWLMPNDFEARVGHKFQFRTKPAPGFDGIVNCEVLELDPPKRLVYSWSGGGLETRVVWVLEGFSGGTRLRLDHTGFQGLRGWMVSRMLDKGWRSKILLRKLPALLERWSGEEPVTDIPGVVCGNDDATRPNQTV